jgi:osmoprotectant transport system ATP-binding protein
MTARMALEGPQTAAKRSVPAAVEFRDVGVSVGDKSLVRGIRFRIAAGETLVLLGRSGSGKTTTLKLINRLHEPTTGEVLVQGKPTTAWDPIALRRHIGYVIQEIGLLPHFSIEENVGLVPRLERWEPDRIRTRVRECLELVGLPPASFAARYPKQLSGGQRQRVGVARALCADPPIVLMDEPFGALDPITRIELQREFRALARSLGKTIVFVTHDVTEAFVLATRIGLFKDGELLLLAEPEEFAASRDPEVLAFLQALEPVKTMRREVLS